MLKKAAHRKSPWAAVVGITIGSLGTFIVFVAAAVWYEYAPVSEQTLRGRQGEGNEMIRQLDEYKTRHGRYPVDLAAAEIDPPSHRRGNWVYRASDNGSDYVLFTRVPGSGSPLYNHDGGWKYFKWAD